MTFKPTLLLAAASAAALVAACGSNDHPSSSAPPPVTQTLDTAQVLALARKSSEISDPFQVDYGLISIGDTSDTSSPIAVNGN